ncbi:MAG: type II toxin-antitoxin system HicB family antitoxin [Rubrobacteraceae bacterium]
MESREILFRVIVEPDLEDGGFVASTPTLKGVYGQGETEEEAMRDFQVALDFTMQAMVEEGEELPASDESARELPTVDDPGRAFRALAEI